MMRMSVPCALALLLAPAMAVAQPASAVPAAQATASAKTMAFMEVMTPRAAFQQQFVDGFVTAMNMGMEKDPGLAQLEAIKPGVTKALKAVMTTEVPKLAAAEYDAYIAPIALFYQDLLTPQEMDVAIAFMRSPAGVRMITRMKAAAMTSVKDAQQAGPVSDMKGALDNAVGNAAVAGITGLQPEDIPAVTAFAKESASIKMNQAQSKIMAITVEQSQALSQRILPKIQPLVIKTVAEFGAKN